MEKCEKTHILGHFRVNVPVQFELVPVQCRFWSFLANLYRYITCTGTTCSGFPVSASFRILDITFSFLILFE